MEYKYILFDLDGTLLDNSEGICAGVNAAINKFSLPSLDTETLKKFIGPPLRDSFRKYCGVDEDMAEEMLVAYREYFDFEGLYRCIPYDGIEKVLSYLYNTGHILYVATAKPTEYAEKMLEKWDLLKYFKKVVGASFDKSKTDKKYIIGEILSLEGDNSAVMVGDTRYDIEGAKLCKIDSVAVTYGFGDVDEIMSEGPDHIVKDTDELLRLMKTFG